MKERKTYIIIVCIAVFVGMLSSLYALRKVLTLEHVIVYQEVGNNKPLNLDKFPHERLDSVLPMKEEAEGQTINQPKPSSKNIVSILFLGIDGTEERAKRKSQFAADTIMIASIDMDNRKMNVLSIPRDTYTYIPATDKMDKINSAFYYGSNEGKGVANMLDAIDHLTGINTIDYYFTLEMEPIPDIINALGGIEMVVEQDMQSHDVNITKGQQWMDGKTAFDYIHWRYDGTGDIGRIGRQHRFIQTLFHQLRTPEHGESLVEQILKNEDHIDTDLDLEQIGTLLLFCSEMNEEDIQFYMLPGKGEYMENISYWVLDEEKTREIVESFVQ